MTRIFTAARLMILTLLIVALWDAKQPAPVKIMCGKAPEWRGKMYV